MEGDRGRDRITICIEEYEKYGKHPSPQPAKIKIKINNKYLFSEMYKTSKLL